MRELFKSSRRRLGVFTLAMALFAAGWWVRSVGREDILHICFGRSLMIIVSRDNSIIFERKQYPSQSIALSKSLTIFRSILKPLNIGISSERTTGESVFDYFLGADSHFFSADSNWQQSLGPVVIGGETYSNLADQYESWFLIAPYWMISVPLTLVSGYLILSGFRTPSKRPPISAAPQNAGDGRSE